MKIKQLLLIALATLAILPLSAQVKSIRIDLRGNYTMVIKVAEREFVTLDSYGQILSVNSNGNFEHYSGFNDHEAGKIKQTGSAHFEYYSGFNDYEAGKIKSLNDIRFTYYSNFYDYEAGKIKTVGDVKFAYNSNFYDYEAGKIKSIGNTQISYYSNFNDYEAGKLKRIGDVTFTYFSNFDGDNLCGKIKSGNRSFDANGIRYIIEFK